MAEQEDDASKTEEPSQKKLDEARKKGQLVSSREINHFFMILALTFFVMVAAPFSAKYGLETLSPYIVKPESIPLNAAGFNDVARHVVLGALAVLAFPFALTLLAAFAPAVVQRKWVFAVEQIKPKPEKISPLAGIKRIFGMKAIVEFLKNMLKVTAVGVIAVMIVMPYRFQLAGSMQGQKFEMLNFAQEVAGQLLIAVCAMLFLLSIFDYFYQRHTFLKQMRMTKQEVKDEYKQQEGDPHVKGKLRQIRREKAKKRMMAAVPTADVVITNPTHYSVALKYDPKTMPAPKVVAMGVDAVALRIRELAEKNKIPVLRNPPLARVLYDTAEIDEEIPVEHYQAVAKVIGYVYKLKGKKLDAPGGKPTLHMPGKKK